jgi:hypothetical protein
VGAFRGCTCSAVGLIDCVVEQTVAEPDPIRFQRTVPLRFRLYASSPRHSHTGMLRSDIDIGVSDISSTIHSAQVALSLGRRVRSIESDKRQVSRKVDHEDNSMSDATKCEADSAGHCVAGFNWETVD